VRRSENHHPTHTHTPTKGRSTEPPQEYSELNNARDDVNGLRLPRKRSPAPSQGVESLHLRRSGARTLPSTPWGIVDEYFSFGALLLAMLL